MPDVGRSDSQRSDSSQRPRVSFNRDVHVKRIGHGGGPRVVGALAGDGAGHLLALPVRRERPNKLSRRELAQEARRVLQQADSVACTSRSPLDSARRFSTLPPVRSRKAPRRSLSFREQSSSHTDLTADRTPSAPPRRAASFKRPRVTLTRSLSDASKSDDKRKSKKTVTTSLDRAKKSKSHSDHSDRSPSPSGVRPKRNILKKSHSDSETAPLHEPVDNRKKKQLSPIIEASPRDDYFVKADASPDGMMHSSQVPASRPTLTRGRTVDAMVKRLSQDRTPRRPPRGVSPSALVSPGDDRRHNNNLPFSYTAAEPTPATPQVIYAEVVVSGGGGPKQTVHTSVAQAQSQQHSDADEDEGLGLSMERPDGGHSRKQLFETIDSSGRGRADGMDSRRKDLMLEGRYNDDGFFQHGYDSSIDYSYKTEYHSDSRLHTDGYYGKDTVDSSVRKEPPIQPRLIDSSDLSSRRDRLESRIESQRKDRFGSSRLNESSYKQQQDILLESRVVDSGRKYPSDPRGSYNNRRDFLNSQLDYDRDNIRQEDPGLFADSGIEVDYRKDATAGSYSSVKTNDGLTAKIIIGSPQPPQVTRVDLNGRAPRPPSDGEETDMAGGRHYRLSSTRLVQEQRRAADTVLVRHYAAAPAPRADERAQHLTDDEYDARGDTEPETESPPRRSTLERGDKSDAKKPPKKKPVSAMDKVKQLFSRNSSDTKSLKKTKKEKKKEEKTKSKDKDEKEPEGDPLTARYTEYKGSAVESDQETITPLSQHHRDYSPPPSPLQHRHHRHHTPSPPSRHHRDQSPPSRHYRDQSPPSRHHRNHSPPSRHRDHSPPSRYREHSPSSRHKDHSPPSRHHVDHSPPSRHQRDHSSPPSRHHKEHLPPSRHREQSPHLFRHREQQSPSPVNRREQQQLLQVPLKDHSSQHRWMSSDTEDQQQVEFVRTRQRMATPTPTPTPSPSPPRAAQSSATLTRINNSKSKEQHSGGWFKSLDRLTRKSRAKTKPEKEAAVITEDEITPHKQNNSSNKNLRFFGDTDQESVTSIPPPMPLQMHRRYKSNSNVTSSTNKLQVPRGPSLRNHRRHHRSAGDVATSSAESTTEGDSSQQSQRSVVYLHAATVGDIPTPAKRSVARRAQSREELSSVASSHMQPQTRTISRSISVLAPWKPRHAREGMEVHYDKEDNNKNYIKNGKPPKVPVSQQTSLNSSTMNRINRRKNAESSKQHKQRVGKATSIESLSQNGSRQAHEGRGMIKKNPTLHPSTSIESLSYRSIQSGLRHQSREKPISKKNSALNASAMELNSSSSRNYKGAVQKKGSDSNGKKGSSKVSRSASMPKDNRVTAGWFKLRNKKQGT